MTTRTDGTVRVRVPAKINLHLGVGDVRPDGFHDLRTVYQAISIHDELTVTADDTIGLTITGEGADALPVDGDNLVITAARLLADRYGVTAGARIHLHKQIPVAGGLAGGSADAAGALIACSRLWNLDVDPADLVPLAAQLGSDIPFCLVGGNALGTGRGEDVTPLPTGAICHWVVVASEGQLSTPRVYGEVDRLREAGRGRFHGDTDTLIAKLADPNADMSPVLHNDMQDAAISLRPEIADIIDTGMADGALAAMVSGSGPTVLLLARDDEHAATLADRTRSRGIARAALTAHGPVPGAHVV